jgi:hypothetical protein
MATTDDRLETQVETQLREWIAEIERLKAKADRAVAEAHREYYDDVTRLREEIEAKLRAWSQALESPAARTEGPEPAARGLIERLRDALQGQLRDLRPLGDDLRRRAEHAEREARRLVQDVRAKREPARAAWGELRVGIEKAWGELRVALDGALTKFREPPPEAGPGDRGPTP